MRCQCLVSFTLLIACVTGCQTAEFAVSYPVTGVHVVAKFEAREPEAPAPEAANAASSEAMRMTTVHRASPARTDLAGRPCVGDDRGLQIGLGLLRMHSRPARELHASDEVVNSP